MNIDEIPGWFPIENRTKMLELIRAHDVRSAIELGAFLGLSTVWLAMHAGHVQVVDRWVEDAIEPNNNNLVETLARSGTPRQFYSIWERNVRNSGVWNQVTPIMGRSHEVHGQVGDADLVYIDGDHSYGGCRRDIELYAPKARKIICGDDYVTRQDFGVIEAVHDMLPGHQHLGPFWWVVK